MISRESKERKEKRNEECGESKAKAKAKANKTKQNLEKLVIKKYIGN